MVENAGENEENTQLAKTGRKSTIKWIAIGAVVLLAIAAAVLFWLRGEQAKKEDSLFAEDAEEMIRIVSGNLDSEGVAYTWTISGKTVTLRMRILTITSDEIAIEYATDLNDPQSMVESMAEKCSEASKAMYDKLTAWGHKNFTVRFEELTSDNVLITAAENGETVFMLTKDNFKYG